MELNEAPGSGLTRVLFYFPDRLDEEAGKCSRIEGFQRNCDVFIGKTTFSCSFPPSVAALHLPYGKHSPCHYRRRPGHPGERGNVPGRIPGPAIQCCSRQRGRFFEKVEKSVRLPQIDVLLLDIGLPGMSGIEGIRHIRQKFPDTDIVMLTTFEEDVKIFKSLC